MSNQKIFSYNKIELNPILWLRADKGVYSDSGITLAGNNDPIYQWNDQSGNDYHVTQSTLGYRPLLKTNVLNGKPVIRFDGIDDFLVSNISISYIDPITIFLIWTNHGTSEIVPIGNTGTAPNYTNHWIHYYGPMNRLSITDNSGNLVNYTTSGDDFTILTTGVWNGVNSKIYENGEIKETGTMNYTIPITGNLFIGCGTSDGTTSYAPLNGDIVEILLYDRALSNTERQTVERYLNLKYNIY